MEKADEELLHRLVPSNPTLRKLYYRHRKLDKEANRFSHYASYSPTASLRHQEIKKEKLKGMDEIRSILADHR